MDPKKGHKKPRKQCVNCGWSCSESTTRQDHHLDECDEYRKRKLPSKEQAKIYSFANSSIRIDTNRKAQLDLLLATAIFTSGRLFTLFEDPSWQVFFNAFGYNLPSADTVKNLLDQVYNTMKLDVKQQIKGKPLLLVTDESTDISQNRLINTSVVTPNGLSYTWDTLEAKEGAQTSEVLFEELLGTATDITDGWLSQIVSLSTDTCGTMRSLWKIVSKNTQTQLCIQINYIYF